MQIPQELYNQILINIPIACVDIAIVEEGAILLVKRNDRPAQGEWWLPGGRVLKGEMMRDAARRKALEEVGIECNVGPIIHTAETIFPDGPDNIPVHSINCVFFLYPLFNKRVLKLDRHHADFRWIKTIEENLNPYVKRCLMAAGLS